MPSKGNTPCVCETCGGVFLAWPSQIRDGRRWCSKTCYDAARATIVKSRLCETCGQPVPASGMRFCRRACRFETPEVRFWRLVQKTTACWLWTGGVVYGYGCFSMPGGRTVRASRFAWEMATGRPIPPGFHVCHDCPDGDDPSCVRNDGVGVHVVDGVAYEKRGHLWLGTREANMRDMHAKGRYPKTRPRKTRPPVHAGSASV